MHMYAHIDYVYADKLLSTFTFVNVRHLTDSGRRWMSHVLNHRALAA